MELLDRCREPVPAQVGRRVFDAAPGREAPGELRDEMPEVKANCVFSAQHRKRVQ